MSNLIRIRNLSKIIVKIHTYLPLKYILTNIYISFLEEFLKIQSIWIRGRGREASRKRGGNTNERL